MVCGGREYLGVLIGGLIVVCGGEYLGVDWGVDCGVWWLMMWWVV